MERLTVKRKDGRWAIANNDGASPMVQMEKIPIAINRLAAYEDTGLMPEEITALMPPNPPLTLEELREMKEASRTKYVCAVTGAPCCWCNPGPCSSRKPEEGTNVAT